ncbi:MAG TPA: hypothetical protein DCS09_12755 [Porphyromonadaceae bacterium]|nr:hypothetical protein [Porphyromonadaceae bacterium]
MTDAELIRTLAAALGWCVTDEDGFSADFNYKSLPSCAFLQSDRWFITAGEDCDYDEPFEPFHNPNHARLAIELLLEKLQVERKKNG